MSSAFDPSPSLFSRLPFTASVARALGRSLVRHLREGRPHAEWPLAYDLMMSVLRQAAQDHPELSKALARASSAPLPLSLRSKVQLTQAALAGLPAELYTPTRSPWDRARRRREQGPGETTFLFLHGGGYVTCSPRTHRDIISRICLELGGRCIAPDYRLAPVHPFPAALEDALACYRSLLEAGQDPGRLFVGGDSAGGGLSLALAVRLRELRLPLPRALVLLSPWVDLSLDHHALAPYADHDYLAVEATLTNAREYAGASALSHPLISPQHADLRGLPPMLIQTGEWELLREQNLTFARTARRAGVTVEHSLYPGMLHAFTCFAGLTEQGARAIAELGQFMRAQLASEEPEAPRAKAS
ncbi:MAG: alpha/beta hydrolase [Myxococcales bacterium]